MAQGPPLSIPTTSDEWNLDLVQELTRLGRPEGEWYDFKKDLPTATKLTRTCCAFANSRGGFLVFGVSCKGAKGNVVGLDPDTEYSVRFHDKLRAEPNIPVPDPTVLELENSKVLYVFEIPESSRKPHIERNEETVKFYKRNSGGNELMTLPEIRGQFIEKNRMYGALRLLVSEVEDLVKIATNFRRQGHQDEIGVEPFDLTILGQALPGCLGLLQDYPRAMQHLGFFRRACNRATLAGDMFVAGRIDSRGFRVKVLNEATTIIQQGKRFLLDIDGMEEVDFVSRWVKDLRDH